MVYVLVLMFKNNFIKQISDFVLKSGKNFLCEVFKSTLYPFFVMFFFLSPISANSQSSSKDEAYLGDIKKGEQVAAGVCAGCHAVDGNSIIPTNPILAAQHAAYIEKQLHNFQIKDGSKKAMRENAVMVVFASALSDEDISDLAAYYNKQKIQPSYAKDKDLALIGESLYKGGDLKNGVPACSSCHGPKGAGIPGQYPRLAGQYSEYTSATLLSYKNGTRMNNNQMMTISKRMSDDQINAVSEYLAGLR